MNKEQIIAEIGKRIKSEYNKHSNSIPDWELIAAAKIWSMMSGEVTWRDEMAKIAEDQLAKLNQVTWWGGNPDMNNTVTGENDTVNRTTDENITVNKPEPHNPNQATLEMMGFRFTQEANCMDGTSDDVEELIVEAKSSLGIDRDGGAFYVLKTEQWAFDDVNELATMLRRVEAALNATNPTSIH